MLKKLVLLFVLIAGVMVGFAEKASATTGIDYVISFVSATKLPDQECGDECAWYQWLYKVKIVEGTQPRRALSHFTIELEDCYDETLLGKIIDTAGANGRGTNPDNLLNKDGNETRYYEVETGKDGSTNIYGIKWNLVSGDFDDIGDYDYFWFSAPSSDKVYNIGLVKFGTNLDKNFYLKTPACPNTDCGEPVVPEPASLLLLGSGLVGAIAARRRKA